MHTTAHCIAALELFDAKPKYPLYDLQKYTTKEGLYELLDNLKWETIPWPQSHQGAGIYAALKLTDTCLALYENKQIGDKVGDYDNDKFGQYIGFLEIDWVYCLTRAGRQTTYRHDDIRRALIKFANEYIDWLYSLDVQTHDGFNDLHMLFGTTCALAELQQKLRGMIETKRPLRLVLDRRPFI